jgi:hypothetical protein
MPTRKQRRRRDKDFRHDVRVYEVDEEGNEIPIAELRAREEASDPPAKGRFQRGSSAGSLKGSGSKGSGSKGSASKGSASRGGRAKGSGSKGRVVREPPQPSWRRAVRRGGVMGAAMLLAFLFLFKSSPIGLRVVWGLFYAVAFIPLTYWIDRTAYRSYLRRTAKKS